MHKLINYFTIYFGIEIGLFRRLFAAISQVNGFVGFIQMNQILHESMNQLFDCKYSNSIIRGLLIDELTLYTDAR